MGARRARPPSGPGLPAARPARSKGKAATVRRKGAGAATPTFQRLLQPLDVHGFPESLAASASLRGSPGDRSASPHPPDALPLPRTHSGTQATGGGTEGSRGKRATERDRESEHLPEPLPPALQHGARHVTARTLPAAVLAPAARPGPERVRGGGVAPARAGGVPRGALTWVRGARRDRPAAAGSSAWSPAVR